MNTCAYGSGNCWVSCLLFMVGWMILSSALLFLSWNKVVATVAKVKTVKFWQTLLLVVTMSVLCAPRTYMKCRSGGCGQGGKCGQSKSCCHESGGKRECPHGGKEKSESTGESEK